MWLASSLSHGKHCDLVVIIVKCPLFWFYAVTLPLGPENDGIMQMQKHPIDYQIIKSCFYFRRAFNDANFGAAAVAVSVTSATEKAKLPAANLEYFGNQFLVP